MMPETTLQDAIAFAEKIRHLVETTAMETQAGAVTANVSIGVASVPHSRIQSAKELIIAADRALYRAKRGGRNQVQAEKRRDPSRSGRDMQTQPAEPAKTEAAKTPTAEAPTVEAR